ncbi:hypothetical protein MBAV_003955 [Candidatus Magnetobacterium bavaricum]|uniref:Uncharacterized protein n=1 Tax=Candidatus Magnetobacterium bavaricum TaxID=29290 RepID=A0A0F3GPN9_9BACT|nr:hypothetical protein MBAV_003955 [Candidatus Magnetobacterium bavaricum]
MGGYLRPVHDVHVDVALVLVLPDDIALAVAVEVGNSLDVPVCRNTFYGVIAAG